MKFRKSLLVLLVMMFAGTSLTAYAGENKTQTMQSESQNPEGQLAQLYHKAGLDKPEVIINTLESLGVSQKDLEDAIIAGKKVYDVLQEKEIGVAEFKKALSNEYNIRIKQAVKDKIITKKEAKTLTKLLNEKMDAWEV